MLNIKKKNNFAKNKINKLVQRKILLYFFIYYFTKLIDFKKKLISAKKKIL